MRYKVYDINCDVFSTLEPSCWSLKPNGKLMYNDADGEADIGGFIPLFYPTNSDDFYIDNVGGNHDCGTGYDPDGNFCGECNCASCCVCGIWERKSKLNLEDKQHE